MTVGPQTAGAVMHKDKITCLGRRSINIRPPAVRREVFSIDYKIIKEV